MHDVLACLVGAAYGGCAKIGPFLGGAANGTQPPTAIKRPNRVGDRGEGRKRTGPELRLPSSNARDASGARRRPTTTTDHGAARCGDLRETACTGDCGRCTTSNQWRFGGGGYPLLVNC
jgi:hypothetical protein